MLVRSGDRLIVEVRAKAEPADDVVTEDYYAQLAQIRLTANPTSRQKAPETPTEVTLDDTDVAKLVECAIRHPNPNMRSVVLAAIWNHADSFRQIFRFGLDAPEGFPELRKVVSEELDKGLSPLKSTDSDRTKPSETLLPRMALPAHLTAMGRTK
jgi:hypothetical protein